MMLQPQKFKKTDSLFLRKRFSPTLQQGSNLAAGAQTIVFTQIPQGPNLFFFQLPNLRKPLNNLVFLSINTSRMLHFKHFGSCGYEFNTVLYLLN